MIELQSLGKAFAVGRGKKINAVRDVSFVARDGRITGLLGPNGAGKSTTLRMISTLLKPDTGSGAIDGHDIRSHALEARRHLGVLPHASGLYPHLTGRENIAYFARLHGMAADAIERRIGELSGQLEMGDFLQRRAKGFSQGQRLKVAMARALVHTPRNLVLDEPTNGLDVMAMRALRSVLLQLRAAGHCILFSSHVMQEVASLCDEVVIIANGRVVENGTPEDIRGRTGAATLEDAFVAAVVDATGTAEGLR